MSIRLSLAFLLCHFAAAAQTHNGLPVIRSTQPKADYRIGDDLIAGRWTISPAADPDVLEVPFTDKTPVTFITNHDSISYTIKDEQPFRFYVLQYDTAYALTEIRGRHMSPLNMDRQDARAYKFVYGEPENNAYLTALRDNYHLKELVHGLKTDSAKILRVLNWVHRQWQHNGGNVPAKPDALTILEEAKTGKMFRCTEYSIVTAAALKSLGYKARVLAIFTSDVETTTSGASHVVAEVYSNELRKWIMADGQFDVMPVLKGTPLNAVEFQDAIVRHYGELELRSLSAVNKRYYTGWIYPYLYYFETDFDNREGQEQKEKIDGRFALRLGPVGAEDPKAFQGKWAMRSAIFTHSYNDLYQAP